LNLNHQTPASIILSQYRSDRARWHGLGLTLATLLRTCADCDSQCVDIRDKIYGAINVASDSEHYDLIPDYSKHPFQLYLYVWTKAISRDGVLLTPREGVLKHCEKLQQLHGDPIWNSNIPAFKIPTDQDNHEQVLQLRISFVQVNFIQRWTITSVGPIIRSGALNKLPIQSITDTVEDPNIRKWGEDITKRFNSLTHRDYHRSQTIGNLYTKDQNTDSLDPFGNLGQYSQAPSPQVDNRVLTTGRCRTFETSEHYIGIASCNVQPGDMVCRVVKDLGTELTL
jgi:hypothetical protein